MAFFNKLLEPLTSVLLMNDNASTTDVSTGVKQRRLLIVGAGGHGRELWSWASHVPPADRDWKLAGFLDANPRALDGFDAPLPILGDPESYQVQPNDLLLCGIGDPTIKLKVCRQLKSRGAHFLTFVHPTAVVGMRNRLGEGTVLGPHAVVSCDATLGEFVMVNPGSTVSHDAVIGDGCTLSGHCDITGGVVLEEGVFLGTHAAVIPRTRVPAYVTVGAGAIVCNEPEAYTTIVGVPARPIQKVPQQGNTCAPTRPPGACVSS